MPSLRRLLQAGLLCATLGVGAIAFAAEELDLRRIGTWQDGERGSIGSMTLDGDLLYVGRRVTSGFSTKSGLTILNVSEPQVPKTLGHFSSTSSAGGIAVSGTTVYFSDGTNGVWVLDVADPQKPKAVGQFTGATNCFGIAARGPQVYLTDYYRGLLVLDVSDPANPVMVSETATGEGASDVVLTGDFAFVATSAEGIGLVNVSNPVAPLLVTNLVLGSQQALSVAVADNTLYATFSDLSSMMGVFDVSDPTKPVLVTNIPSGIGLRVAHSDGLVAVTATRSSDSFSVFSANSQHSTLSGQFPFPKFALASRFAMNRQHAFVAADGPMLTSAIEVLAISEPAKPLSGGFVPFDRPGVSIRDVFGSKPGAVHVLRGDDSLTTFSTTIPFAPTPTRTNTFEWFGRGGLDPKMKFSGNLGFAWSDPRGPWVVDFSDPLSPSPIGEFPSGMNGRDFVFDGVRGFGVNRNLLYRLDLSAPAKPTLISSLTNSGNYWAVALFGNHLYAGTEAATLQVFDISVPEAFTQHASQSVSGRPTEMIVSGERLYSLEAGRTVAIYSLAVPGTPVLLGTYTNSTQYETAPFHAMLLHGDFLYCQIWNGGFEVLDVSQPEYIRRVGGNSLPVVSIATDGQALYATTSTGMRGMRIYPLMQGQPIRVLNPHLNNGRVSFEVRGTVGRTVSLERAVTLGDWKPWRSVSFASDTITVEDDVGDTTAFYRIVDP